MKYFFIYILKGYKYFISPLLGNRCRFYPSCSEYMMTSIDRFGIFKGITLGLKRIGRCHPGCEGGIDHVPEIYPYSKHKHKLNACNNEKNPDKKCKNCK